MARERSRPEKDAKPKSVGYRGSAGANRVEEEVRKARERANEPRKPFRYRANYKDPKAKNELIILDETLDDAFYMHEHGIQDADGKWGRVFEVCVQETAVSCPLCKVAEADGKKSKVGRAAYCLVLTVLDLTPYYNEKRKETVYASKRLMVIRGTQVSEWLDILQAAQEDNDGVLRGTYMRVSRTEQKSFGKPKILKEDFYGDPVKGGKLYTFVDDETLEEEFGHDAVKADDGKVLKEADADITVYNYDELFPFPDLDALADKYGGGARRDEDDAEWERGSRRGRGRSRDKDDDGEEEKPRRSRRAAADEDEEEPEEKPARRGRGKAAEPDEDEEAEEEPAPRKRGRAAEPEEDEDEPPRARKRVAAGKPAPKPPKRTRDAEDEVDEEPAPRKRGKAAAVEDDESEEKPARRSRAKAEDDDVPTRKRGSAPKRSRNTEEDEDEETPF